VESESTINFGIPYGMGEYVMTVYFGTLLQKLVVVKVDTGSDLV
jgi:hypothetical protein